MSSMEALEAGSPPHTWRIQQLLKPKPLQMGITSTHVENTMAAKPKVQWQEDHLHTRGEYALIVQVRSPASGSPPHTWRIPAAATTINTKARITSTHVENTNIADDGRHAMRDHLHTRGEYLSGFNVRFAYDRITSTHVENTILTLSRLLKY